MNDKFDTGLSAGHDGDGEEFGVIYFGWQGAEAGTGAHRNRWKAFAEAKLADDPFRPGKSIRRRWIGGDLFLFVSIPASANHMTGEEWLLHAVRRIRSDWEAGMLRAGGRSGVPARLHAGVACCAGDISRIRRDEWYDLLKQAVIHGREPDAPERSLKRIALQRIIERSEIDPVYQPIKSLTNGGVFGYEALTRLRGTEWFGGPLELFKFAESEGAYYALDRLARSKAIANSGAGSGTKLFINIVAQIMDDPHFSPGLTLQLLKRYGMTPSSVVFEITERSSIEDFSAVKKVLAHYRSQGYQIAIDDVGAGYSSLQSIVELRPDYLKVDRSIIDSVDRDPVKQHVISTIVRLAEQTGSTVIAEGIERPEELMTVRAMGVPLGQGYWLGRPERRSSSL